MEKVEADIEEKKTRPRGLWVGAGVGALFLFALPVWAGLNSKQAAPYAFLTKARVVRQQDWIESGSSGPGRLKTNGEYVLPGSLEEVATLADSLLSQPGWKLDKRSKTEVKYNGGMSYVTLLNRPSAHEVKIHVQSYRTPRFSDRVRLWAKKVGLIR